MGDMTTPAVTERGRLTALRAGWLFDGTGSALIPDPLVVIDGGIIVAVGSGAARAGRRGTSSTWAGRRCCPGWSTPTSTWPSTPARTRSARWRPGPTRRRWRR